MPALRQNKIQLYTPLIINITPFFSPFCQKQVNLRPYGIE